MIELLVSAATEAAFGYLLESSGLAERVRSRLGRDPEQVAFKVALAQALSTVARSHPRWTGELFFDQTFLVGPAAPLLAGALTRDGSLTAEALAASWARHLAVGNEQALAQRAAYALPIATTFVEAFEAALRARPEFQALWDSRALERVADATEETAQSARRLDTSLRELTEALAGLRAAVNTAGGAYVAGDVDAQTFVGRDFIQLVVQPLRQVSQLPFDYATRIENFLQEYLGTPDRKVPFGGREAELARLDAWLADPAAPPRLLVAAEAGRGKTALLARWAARLRARGDLHVVFVPVSIRFNMASETVFYSTLVAQLGAVYRGTINWESVQGTDLRGLAESLMRQPPPDGKALIVILDALDEASDWQPAADAGILAMVETTFFASRS